MKKLMIGAIVLVSTAASAAAPTVSDNASSNACFGQARAYYAQLLAAMGSSNGFYISQRKGTNPENNANYIAENCE